MVDRDDHPEERARVRGKIGPAVKTFAAAHIGRQFHVEELRRYVRREGFPIAPDSPGRTLRELRQDGELDYECVDRRQSLYVIVTPDQPALPLPLPKAPRPKRENHSAKQLELRSDRGKPFQSGSDFWNSIRAQGRKAPWQKT